ncbi:unnamed protein product [Adineta steineri]|uniref:Aminoglycoside phosphotransferase domain-containing protein n=1 Tax=Adineta steineri TaxID=433720 RepID=A0A813MWF9_9BILA|nr:unnamed protein product [Adineta steineri]CAF4020517.1 unnamed protein product [Adineta steineri]
MDLTTINGLKEYLVTILFLDVDKIKLLSSAANFTYRVDLQQVYKGCMSIIVKHAAPFVANRQDISFDQERLKFEYQALTAINDSEIISLDSIVQISKVYHYDPVYHILVLEDFGDLPTLIQLIDNKQLNTDMTPKLGNELGSFLANFHRWASGNEHLNKRPQNSVNQLPLTLLSLYAQSDIKYDKYLFSDKEKRLFSEVVKLQTKNTMNDVKTFIMGDFWIGNILIDIHSEMNTIQRIYIIDWEMARHGLPSNDIAHFCHQLFMYSYFDNCLLSDIVMSSFLRTYAQLFNLDIEYIKDAAIVLGALITVWAFNFDTDIQETIQLGIEYMTKALATDHTWLNKSVLKHLIRTDYLDTNETSNNSSHEYHSNKFMDTDLK